MRGPLTPVVFGDNPGFIAGNIGGFAQAADDARAVIDFAHSNPIPLGYESGQACQASGETHYDVSIGPESGLQVPVKNAGPDTASGTVTVTAVDSNGAAIPTFPRNYTFTLLAGTSQSVTEGFGIAYATTITWTATATAEFDVNPANNTVTATTTVTGAKGGGRR